MATEHKRGKLSKEEEQFISDNISKMSVVEIARSLNRTTEPVHRYIKDNNLISAQMTDDEGNRARLRAFLHGRNYWEDVEKQFDDNELKTFEENWISIFQQFREDCAYTEELDIKQFCVIEALINRNLITVHKVRSQIEDIQRKIDKEYEKDKDMRDMPLITNLESQMSFLRTSVASAESAFKNLTEQKDKISKSLKAQRTDRIKRIEDSKTSWVGTLKLLEDAEIRDRLGKNVALMSVATERAYDRLSSYHTYLDNKIDRPILNSDTVDKDENDGKEETD